MIPSISLAAPHAGVSVPMAILLAKATLILLLALGATMLMRRAAAGTRHLVWLVALGALLVLPALATWAPLPLAVLPATAASATTSASTGATRSPAAIDAPSPAGGRVAAPELRDLDAGPGSPLEARQRIAIGATTVLVGIWALVALGLATWLAVGALAVARIVRHARPLEGGDWRTPLLEIADRLGIDEAPRLVRSEEVKMPFACGLLRPTIVLPAEADAWTLERRRAVLLHELGHVRRRDLVGHTLGRLACAAYWFHPLVWTAARRLRAESERACDDLALTCGARASDYAEHLLDIVTGVRGETTPAVALAMARRREFEGRMLAILDPELRRSGPGRRQAALLTAAFALLSVVVGAAAPVARAAARPPASGTALDTRSVEAPVMPGEPSPASDTLPLPVRRQTPAVRADIEASVHVGASLPRAAEETAPALVGTVAAAAVGAIDATARPRETGVSLRSRQQQQQQQRGDDRPALLAGVLRRDSSAELRRVAAWGLEQYADRDVAVDALVAALRGDRSAAVREMAAWALANAERTARVREALEGALRSDADARVRTTAAWALGGAGDEDAIPALTDALGAESAALRMRAAWAIGSIEPKRAPRQLIALLGDREPQVRRVAAWALFRIEDPDAVSALDAALARETDPEARRGEIRALAAMGDRSVEAVRKLLDAKDPELRASAIRALAGTHAGGPWPWPWPDPRPYP